MACNQAKKTKRAICECTLGPKPPSPPAEPSAPATALSGPVVPVVVIGVLLAVLICALLAGGVWLPDAAPKALMSSGEAEAQTNRIVQLMQKDWQRDNLKPGDLDLHVQTDKGSWETRSGCEDLLKDIRRAVPLKMLLEHGDGSLHRAKQKEDLKTEHFFLSTPVQKLKAFVSHRWDTDPRETADALTLHIKMRVFLVLVLLVFLLMTMLAFSFPPAFVVVYPVLGALPIAVFNSKSNLILRLAGATEPLYWFDKVSLSSK